MKIRLHEIELGTSDPKQCKDFYTSVLGLEASVNQEQLTVFDSGTGGLDFNTSTHLPSKAVLTSFLTDNLEYVIDRLNKLGVQFEGPKQSHLGMKSIEFRDPDGYAIKVNQPTDESPTWLKV